MLEFPKCLYRGDLTCIVMDANEEAAKLSGGWQTAAHLHAPAPERPNLTHDPLASVVEHVVADAAPKRRGRPPKSLE